MAIIEGNYHLPICDGNYPLTVGACALVDAWTAFSHGASPMRVHADFFKAIGFIGIPGPGEPNGPSWLDGAVWGGTGFFVYVPTAQRRSYVPYFVTAKHSVDEIAGREFIIRTNSPQGAAHGRVLANAKWWFHPDTPDAVDAAVLPCIPPVEQLDLRLLMTDEWITDEIIKQRDIGPGDEVFLTGLFALLVGAGMNSPIARTGNIAMIPKDKIPDVKIGKWRGDVEMYLIEVRSTGGISGSPVFVRETTPSRVYGRGHPRFLGLVHGHWSIKPEDRNKPQIRPFVDDPDRINLGIALVVPAQKIMEILNHPELVEMRKTAAEQLENKATSESDSRGTASFFSDPADSPKRHNGDQPARAGQRTAVARIGSLGSRELLGYRPPGSTECLICHPAEVDSYGLPKNGDVIESVSRAMTAALDKQILGGCDCPLGCCTCSGRSAQAFLPGHEGDGGVFGDAAQEQTPADARDDTGETWRDRSPLL